MSIFFACFWDHSGCIHTQHSLNVPFQKSRMLNISYFSSTQLINLSHDWNSWKLPSNRRHGTLAKNHGKSLASLAKILPWSYQDLAKDTTITQDRAKRTMFYHDLGKDAKINHVFDKASIVANPFFGNSYFLIVFIFIAPVSIAFSNFANFNVT